MDTIVEELQSGDETLRRRTMLVLQSGFRITAVLIAAGSLLALIRQEPLPHTLGSPAEILRGVADTDAGSVIGLGIVSVILTPLVATGVICATFARSGDRRQAGITGVVLAILLVSISLSVL